jgi:uncharacterized protein YjbI with pentapeptide repeats
VNTGLTVTFNRLTKQERFEMKFEVKNRWTGNVQFTAKIKCSEDAPLRVKLGFAVQWAYKHGADLRGAVLSGAGLRDAVLSGADLRDAVLSGADLRGADLRDAVLSGADLRDAVLRGADLRDAVLSGADLRDAVLSGADLRDAVLSGADLRSFRNDVWSVLTENRNEIAGLAAAIREGRIDGKVYDGACACLVGTIANVRGVSADTLPQNASRPAEQWFLMINTGDKPGDDSGGGFAAKKALEWIEEWAALSGVDVSGASLESAVMPRDLP